MGSPSRRATATMVMPGSVRGRPRSGAMGWTRTAMGSTGPMRMRVPRLPHVPMRRATTTTRMPGLPWSSARPFQECSRGRPRADQAVAEHLCGIGRNGRGRGWCRRGGDARPAVPGPRSGSVKLVGLPALSSLQGLEALRETGEHILLIRNDTLVDVPRSRMSSASRGAVDRTELLLTDLSPLLGIGLVDETLTILGNAPCEAEVDPLVAHLRGVNPDLRSRWETTEAVDAVASDPSKATRRWPRAEI